MNHLKFAFKNTMALLGGLEVFGQFFQFAEWMHSLVAADPVLACISIIIFNIVTVIIWDVDRERRKSEYKQMLKGASRRKRRMLGR